MASLTGQTIQSTYDALLKISGNDALTSSLQRITDGLGNFSPLYLSTTAVEISSGLNVVGSITGSNLSGTNTGDETNSTIKSKLGAATSSNDGYLTSTDWSTFNAKQNALGYTPVPNTRSLTINGTAYDLSADRSWSVGTVTSVGLSVPTGFAVSNSPVTGSGTLGLSFAAGYSLPTNLSQASWDTAFSSRIATFTTTGNSGAATFASNTLNIPNYTLSGLGGVPTTRTLTINGTSYDLSADRSWTISTGLSGSGTTNYIPKFTGSTSLGNSLIFDNGTNVGIGTTAPAAILEVSSGVPTSSEVQRWSYNNANPDFTLKLRQDVSSGLVKHVFDVVNLGTTYSNNLVLTNGNIGIGTSSPSYVLDAYSTGASTARISIKGTTNYSLLQSENDSGTLYLGIDSSTGGAFGTGAYSRLVWSGGAYPLVFGTNATERMRITSGGNVGIGTTAPEANLHVNRTSDGTVAVFGRSGGSIIPRLRIDISEADNTISFNPNYAGAVSPSMRFLTNEVERMRIISGGSVGIGLTNPTRKLSISSSLNQPELQIIGTGVNVRAQLETTNDYGTWLWGVTGGDTTGDGIIYSAAAKNLRIFTSDTERMRITSGGNVGIGTTSPSSLLNVGGSSGAVSTPTAIQMDGTYRTGGDSFSSLKFYLYKGTSETYGFGLGDLADVQYWAGSSSTGAHRFFTSQTERMRITSGGNVGIGTSSPDKRLHVSGSDTVLRIQSGTGGVYMQMDSGASSSYIGQLGTSMYFENGGSERMRITSGGNVGLNTSSPSYRLDVNGDIRSTGVIRVNTGTIDTVMTFDTGAGAIGTLTNHNLNFWINGTAQAKITTGNQFYVGTGVVDGSAKVQIDSTTQGFLPPRMTSLQRIAITTPAVGLIVYQTDNAGGLGGNEGLYVYKSGGWTFII